MLGKLIKYEFSASSRVMPLIYLVVLLLGISGVIFSTSDMFILSGISFFFLVLAGAAALLITYVAIFTRYHKGMFREEGYLAMTLPVTTFQLYLTKTLVSLCWMALSMVVTFGAWFASIMLLIREDLWGSSMGYMPAYVWEEMLSAMQGAFTPVAVLFTIFFTLAGYLSFIGQVFFCITLSNVRPFHSNGIGTSVIAFVLLQIVTFITRTFLSALIPLNIIYTPYIGWGLSDYVQNGMGGTTIIGVVPLLFTLFFAFVLPIFTVHMLEHKVNLK